MYRDDDTLNFNIVKFYFRVIVQGFRKFPSVQLLGWNGLIHNWVCTSGRLLKDVCYLLTRLLSLKRRYNEWQCVNIKRWVSVSCIWVGLNKMSFFIFCYKILVLDYPRVISLPSYIYTEDKIDSRNAIILDWSSVMW